IERTPITVHQNHVPGNQSVSADFHGGITDDPCSMHESIVTETHATAPPNVEHRAQIDRRPAADLHSHRLLAPVTVETEGRLHVGRLIDPHIRGNRAWIPVPGESSARLHSPQTSPTIWAGLPRMRTRWGTSCATSEPGSTNAPLPMRTPLRMVALGPIQTLSSMITGRRGIAGL